MQGNIFRFAEMYFIYSAIYKAAGLTVPGHSMILTGTNPVEQESVHWLSMGGHRQEWPLGGRGHSGHQFFGEQLVTKEPAVCEWCC